MTKFILAAIPLLLFGVVHAEELNRPSDSQVATFGEWDALKSQNMLLKIKIDNIKLKNELGNLNGDSQVPSTAIANGNRTYTVQLITGVGTSLSAILCTPSGATIKVVKGANVPGLGTIKSITSSEVVAGGVHGSVSVPIGADGTCSPPIAPTAGQQLGAGVRQ